MQTDEFVRRVQERAGITSGDAALTAIMAALETLSERLPRNVRDDLAAQLPQQLQNYLTRSRETEQFALEEYYNRVAGRSDVGLPQAIEWAQAVIGVLQEAVTPGQMQEVRTQLPQKFDELFSGEAYDTGSPSA